jgi:hypothetical protein
MDKTKLESLLGALFLASMSYSQYTRLLLPHLAFMSHRLCIYLPYILYPFPCTSSQTRARSCLSRIHLASRSTRNMPSPPLPLVQSLSPRIAVLTSEYVTQSCEANGCRGLEELLRPWEGGTERGGRGSR